MKSLNFLCTALCVLFVDTSTAVAVRIAPGPDWVPIDYRKGVEPGSALDFSVFGLADAPAGKHGRRLSAAGRPQRQAY